MAPEIRITSRPAAADSKARGDYGYDAPCALLAFAAAGASTLGAAAVAWWTHRGPAAPLSAYGTFFLANALCFLYTTRRGAVLVAVARRLTTGRVTGIDLWSTHDQSGNARDVTLRNAPLEGVADRVTIQTGDMRRSLGWRFWCGNPFAGTTLVTASKR